MDPHRRNSRLWALARRQHGVVSWAQLLGLGFTAKAIEHRIAKGRLHRIHRGVYAVGRPELTQRGHWMAAVLYCGPTALLSHESAAALWRIRLEPRRPPGSPSPIHVSLDAAVFRQSDGIRIHRRSNLTPADRATHHDIRVTSPVCTLVDLAATLPRGEVEAAIGEADKLDLVNPEDLRAALDDLPRRPGLAKLRKLLDRHTFRLTDSELERLFLPIARRVGLPPPLTRRWVNGYRVDFFWPGLGLVVETDGLRYHRTPAQQARDRRRDQVHTAAGLTPLRFTHYEVRFEAGHVEAVLKKVTHCLRSTAASPFDADPSPL
jgi:very-short-patch-repair endonuclease